MSPTDEPHDSDESDASEEQDALVRIPFSYRITKAGKVLIDRDGRLVVTVAGTAADRLIERLAAAPDERARQLCLAKVTGNYRRGNERRG